jgi:hypothetical protein
VSSLETLGLTVSWGWPIPTAPMKTKTRRQLQLRAIARLTAQCRLNVGDCASHGRLTEAAAWEDVLFYLQSLASFVASHGLPVQRTLFGQEDDRAGG